MTTTSTVASVLCPVLRRLVRADSNEYCPILASAKPCCPRWWQGARIKPPQVQMVVPQTIPMELE